METGVIAAVVLAGAEFETIISELMKSLNDLAPDAGFTFGGGEFGGGGAVRPFLKTIDEIEYLEESLEEEVLTFIPPRIENIIVITKSLPWKEF